MLNFPGWVLANISPVYSNLLSYLSFGLMLLYFILSKKWALNGWMLLLGVLYFGIGSLTDQTYTHDSLPHIILIIKFFIVAIGGYAVVKDTSKTELFFFLLIGAISVFIEIFFYLNPLENRFSGFYLNPNSLGFICMMGYALTFGLDRKWRPLGQIAFTVIGFITFSRTFLVVWLLMNLLSIRLSLKNLRVLVVGVSLFVGLLTYNAFLPNSNPRLEAMSNILAGKSNNASKLKEGSRTETWALFYDALMDKPILGHGYGSFDGGGKISIIGPHNSFIKTWGEGGILTLIVILTLYGLMIKKSWGIFLQRPHLFLMTLALCLYMNTDHTFWINGYMLFFSMWLQYHILSVSKTIETQEKIVAKRT